MRDYDDMLDAAMHEHFEDQGDAIDRAMDAKAEQDMLADNEYDKWVDNPVLAGMRQWGIAPENALATLNHESITYDHILDWCESWEWASPEQVEEARQALYDDPEADAADAQDAEAEKWAGAYYHERGQRMTAEESALAYEPDDPKGKHALGWTNE